MGRNRAGYCARLQEEEARREDARCREAFDWGLADGIANKEALVRLKATQPSSFLVNREMRRTGGGCLRQRLLKSAARVGRRFLLGQSCFLFGSLAKRMPKAGLAARWPGGDHSCLLVFSDAQTAP